MIWIGIGIGVVAGLVLGFLIGCFALLWGLVEGLTDIDGPPKMGLIEDWKNRRAYKKEQKGK